MAAYTPLGDLNLRVLMLNTYEARPAEVQRRGATMELHHGL